MKKFIIGIAAAFSGIYVAGYFIPFQGPWVDRIVSDRLSKDLHARVRVGGSSVSRWSVLAFHSMSLADVDGKNLISSGMGRIHRSGSQDTIYLSNLVFSPEITGQLTVFASFLPDGGKGLGGAKEVLAIVVRRKETTTLHVRRWVSDQFILRGGVRFVGGKLLKAHALLQFSGSFLEGLPMEVRSRLIAKPDGTGEIRLAYGSNQISLSGATGPLLKAMWQRPA